MLQLFLMVKCLKKLTKKLTVTAKKQISNCTKNVQCDNEVSIFLFLKQKYDIITSGAPRWNNNIYIIYSVYILLK